MITDLQAISLSGFGIREMLASASLRKYFLLFCFLKEYEKTGVNSSVNV